jgi:hypothetical protein
VPTPISEPVTAAPAKRGRTQKTAPVAEKAVERKRGANRPAKAMAARKPSRAAPKVTRRRPKAGR